MPGECIGFADCGDLGESDCWDCDCSWDFGRCDGEIDCGNYGDQFQCEDCGCEWYEPPPIGDFVKLNIADVFRDATEMKINIGDTFRTVVEIKINIGNVWRTVYIA